MNICKLCKKLFKPYRNTLGIFCSRRCSAIGRPRKSLLEYFWVKIHKTENCWEWKGATRSGYGALHYKGKNYAAHRLSYTTHHGKIPQGMFVLHKCDNPPCTNPDHLFLGTQADNITDMISKNRRSFGGSKISHVIAEEIRKLWKTGKYTQEEIGRKFEFHQSNVSKIVHHISWAK